MAQLTEALIKKMSMEQVAGDEVFTKVFEMDQLRYNTAAKQDCANV